ncbi:response regulator [Streptomyces sp. NPDC001107]
MRILVVEDEPKMRDLLRRALSEEGYAVDTAADGPQALALTDVAAFDAMVLVLAGAGYVTLSRFREAQSEYGTATGIARQAQ